MEQVSAWGRVFYYEPLPDSPWKPRTVLCQACGYGYEHHHKTMYGDRMMCDGDYTMCQEAHNRTGKPFDTKIPGVE